MRAKAHFKARCQVCFVYWANTVETGRSLALQTRTTMIQSTMRSQSQQYATASQKRARTWPHIPRRLNPITFPHQLQMPLLKGTPIRPITRRSMTSRSTAPLVVMMVSERQTPRGWVTKPATTPKNPSPFAILCSHIRRSLYLPLYHPILVILPCPLPTSHLKTTVIQATSSSSHRAS